MTNYAAPQNNGHSAGGSDGHSESGHCVRRPPRWVGLRGFAHDEPATLPQEGRGALGCHGWSAKASGHDHVELTTAARVPTQHLGTVVYDLDSTREAQSAAGLPQKSGTAKVGVKERPCCVLMVDGQYQAREPAPAT